MVETLFSHLALANVRFFEKTVALFTLLRLVDPWQRLRSD
jgi:hypothetical protein